MNSQRSRLSDEDLLATEASLRESLRMLHADSDPDPSRAALRSALELGLNLIEEVRTERRKRDFPVRSIVDDEHAALREYMGVLMPIARIAESLWVDMARSSVAYGDTPTRRRVVSRLGGALRALKSVDARAGMRFGLGSAGAA